MEVEWIPTKKNLLIKEFFESLGFKNFKNKRNSISLKEMIIKKYHITHKKGKFIESN